MTAVVAGCALVAAAGGVGVSLAYLNDEARSGDNAAATGTIVLTDVVQGSSVLPTGANVRVRPGGGISALQVAGNGGSVPGSLVITTSSIVDSTNTLSSALRLKIEECATFSDATCATATSRYDGPLAGASSNPVPLAAGQQKRFRVRVYWRSSDDNTALHNDTTTFKLNWRLRT
jgi:hypothetical protein